MNTNCISSPIGRKKFSLKFKSRENKSFIVNVVEYLIQIKSLFMLIIIYMCFRTATALKKRRTQEIPMYIESMQRNPTTQHDFHVVFRREKRLRAGVSNRRRASDSCSGIRCSPGRPSMVLRVRREIHHDFGNIS